MSFVMWIPDGAVGLEETSGVIWVSAGAVAMAPVVTVSVVGPLLQGRVLTPGRILGGSILC